MAPGRPITATIRRTLPQVWSFTRSPHFARWQHAATALQDGRVLVAGGMSGDGAEFPAMTEIFIPARQEWIDAGALSKPTYSHTLTLLSDGRVLLVGGWKIGNPPYFGVQLFDP